MIAYKNLIRDSSRNQTPLLTDLVTVFDLFHYTEYNALQLFSDLTFSGLESFLKLTFTAILLNHSYLLFMTSTTR